MKIDKCPGCGATKFKTTIDGKVICEYCNTTVSVNPPEVVAQPSSYFSETTNDTDNLSSYETTPDSVENNPKKAKPISIFVFLVLFFFTPPIAIIYLILSVISHKNNK